MNYKYVLFGVLRLSKTELIIPIKTLIIDHQLLNVLYSFDIYEISENQYDKISNFLSNFTELIIQKNCIIIFTAQLSRVISLFFEAGNFKKIPHTKIKTDLVQIVDNYFDKKKFLMYDEILCHVIDSYIINDTVDMINDCAMEAHYIYNYDKDVFKFMINNFDLYILTYNTTFFIDVSKIFIFFDEDFHLLDHKLIPNDQIKNKLGDLFKTNNKNSKYHRRNCVEYIINMCEIDHIKVKFCKFIKSIFDIEGFISNISADIIQLPLHECYCFRKTNLKLTKHVLDIIKLNMI